MQQHHPKTREIIRSRNGAQPSRERAAQEVHFQVAGNTRLRLRPSNSRSRMLLYLGQQIKQRPRDLRAHMQRIFLLLEAAEEPQLFGALVDLFIVLGSAGTALKVRCLTQAAPVLTESHRLFLEQAAEGGLQPDNPTLARIRHSVLSMGFSGRAAIVAKREQQSGGYQSPYDEAMACLEYGQLDEARRVLEEALRRMSDDPRISRQLLEIYQRTRDDNAFRAMRNWLQDNYGVLPDGW